jgi:hypothetical protein
MAAMRRLAQRLAENTGASLGAAGVLVAAGLGLTQAPDEWLFLGIVLSGIAVAWAAVTLWGAITTTSRAAAFRRALGRALEEGEDILRSKPDDEQARSWSKGVHDLINAGLGESEAALFMSSHDLGTIFQSPTTTEADLFMERRLQRLSRLLDRIHSMSVGIDFDPEQWTQ